MVKKPLPTDVARTSDRCAHPAPVSMADKVEHLFRVVQPAPGAEYPNETVARLIETHGWSPISGAYIGMLRRGTRDNPSKKHLEGLAGFFGVSPAYFFNDEVAETLQRDLGLAVELRASPARELSLRVEGISAQGLAAISQFLEQVRWSEGLPTKSPTAVRHRDR